VDQHFCLPATLQGLLEPDAVKVARPVLRGPGRSNAPRLPDKAVCMAKGSSVFAAAGLIEEAAGEYRRSVADSR